MKMNNGQRILKKPRARLVHEKESRRQSILKAALELYGVRGFQSITVGDVAVASDLGKGTIYLYFNTKEEIFLNLLEGVLMGWFEALDEGLRGSSQALFPEPMVSSKVARCLTDAFEGQPNLIPLLAILSTHLEPKVDRLELLGFKEFLADRCLRTGRLLEQRLPFLEEGQGAELVLQAQALAVGLWHLSTPSPQARELLKAPGLGVLDVPFRPRFEATLGALMAGMECQGRGTP